MKRQLCPICNRRRFVKFLQADNTCKLTGFLIKKNCTGRVVATNLQPKIYFFNFKNQ